MLLQTNADTSAPDSVAATGDRNPLQTQQRDQASVESPLFSVALLTPWDQECGNAEYAKRLATGLRRFSDLKPIELVNFTDTEREYSTRRRRRVCLEIARQANAAAGDLIHIQHEFCFFGRRIRESNRNFGLIMRRLRKPVVVTLHTWLAGLTRRRHKRWWRNAAEAVKFRMLKRQFGRPLRRAAAIVVHSQETYQRLVSTYPRLKKKTFVIPIPVEPIDHRGITPPIRKRPDERWILVPGFVSRYKGHSHAIAALRLLPETFRLVVAGGVHPKDKHGPEYWMGLLGEADAAGLQNRVLFTGFMSDPHQQAAVLHQADCFLLPYDEVGQSGSAVLADALSHDRPVITSTAKSMFAYRGLPDTVFSSVAVDVTCPETLAATIETCVGDGLPGIPLARRQQQAVRQHYSLNETEARYRRAYAFAAQGDSA